MDVAYVTRFNDSRNEGGGNHSKLIYEGLDKNPDIDLHLLTQDDSIFKSDSKYDYAFYSFLELKFLLNKKEFKDCDVQHGFTILESLYLDKKKAVAGVLDIPKDGLGGSPMDRLFDKCFKATCECERIIANNCDIVERLKRFYNVDEDKITVIPPPIPQNIHFKEMKRDDDTQEVIYLLLICFFYL